MNYFWEMCPHCDEEVKLVRDFRRQLCPNCGKYISPCNICTSSTCTPCPLEVEFEILGGK